MTLATSKRNKGLPSPADARKVPVEKGRQSEHVTYLHNAKEKPLVSKGISTIFIASKIQFPDYFTTNVVTHLLKIT